MLKFAIIGFGGLGQTHFRRYKDVKARACCDIELVALCDIEDKFDKQVSTNIAGESASSSTSNYNTYLSVEELLENEELDFVITALPTYLHAKIAIQVMEKGIHVFSEKPMAISVEEAEAMLEASKKYNTKLMIGQCCRYSGSYTKLKEIVESGEYGKLIRAEFRRISMTPLWGWQNWFMDVKKSGGALLDMHVHDVDMINYIFGMPKAVSSVATHFKSGYDSVNTSYDYDGAVITSVGDWGCTAKYPFTATFYAQFENAVLDGIEDVKITAYTDDEIKELEIDTTDCYTNEMVDFISCIANDRQSEINPPEASLASLKIAFAEKESADADKKVLL